MPGNGTRIAEAIREIIGYIDYDDDGVPAKTEVINVGEAFDARAIDTDDKESRLRIEELIARLSEAGWQTEIRFDDEAIGALVRIAIFVRSATVSRLSVRGVLVGVGVIALLCMGNAGLGPDVQEALADPWPGTNQGLIADNYEHTFCWGSGFNDTDLRQAARYSFSNLATQTNFTRLYMSSCSTNTDVRFLQGLQQGDARGEYFCLAWTGIRCLRARIRLNRIVLTNTLNRRKTACHEVGHSGGLEHGNKTDCMFSGPVTSGHQQYHGHHIDHLNSH